MLRRLKPLMYVVMLLSTLSAQVKAEGGAEDEKSATSTSEYLNVSPALITNYGGPGPIHFIKAEIALRVGKNQDDALKVSHHLPQIRHVLIMLFSRQTEENISSMEGKEQLRRDALAAVQNVIKQEEGKPIVEDLLFNNFIIQR